MSLFLSTTSFAQTDGLGTWNTLSSKFAFHKQWYGFFEAQLRSQKTVHDFDYYEYKAGIGYNFPKNVSIVLAMGHYVTFCQMVILKNLSLMMNSEYGNNLYSPIILAG